MTPTRFLTINNIQIACYEQHVTASKTIFFIHGNGGSARFWQPQFESPLLAGYKLVAIDLPAHGNSGAAADPAENYSLPVTGRIVAEAYYKLCTPQHTVIAGFSYGANIAAEMLNYNTSYAGIALSGPTILGKDHTIPDVFMDLSSMIHFMDMPPVNEVRDFFAGILLQQHADLINLLTDDYFRVKTPFRSILLQNTQAGKVSDEVELLAQQEVPVLIVFGENEKTVFNTYLNDAPFPRWQNKIFTIPDAAHYVSLEQPAAFTHLLKEYVEECLGDQTLLKGKPD